MDVTYLVLNPYAKFKKQQFTPNQTEHIILKESYVIESKLCERNNYVNSYFSEISLILSTWASQQILKEDCYYGFSA